MTKERTYAVIIGIFYILAFASSVIAVILYQPINNPLDWYHVASNGEVNQVLWGVLNDVLLLVSAVGTTVFLAPYLAKYDKQLALAYFSFRFMEAVFIAIGIVSMLVLVSLSQHFNSGFIDHSDLLISSGYAWQAVHRWIMILGPNLMLGINTSLYSYLLLKTELVPKRLAQFGLVTAIMVFVAGILDMFGIIEPWSTTKGLISLPVGIYEMSLAIYLIVKGFKPNALITITKN
ncbi:DUF4386 domain-containing protein [Fundicoccus culcitae]|uniref:DUF4386 domain-containing protein n=1 Tax=Fundicoccus culcitae TaxID=2969821 RepID=A0ABY5P686_9LACT|nr:DUF4386 domain-containing protein [Fundicoccus culcitae]UUX34120.1 DUF4386 domain-containing protein [Fundicoccus culcitae]